MIKSVKISLLEKDLNRESSSEEKDPYIKKATGTLDVEKYLGSEYSDEKAEEFIKESLKPAFELLVQQNSSNVDTLGMWVETDDGVFELAMSLETLSNIEKFSIEEVDSIYEMYKLTYDSQIL